MDFNDKLYLTRKERRAASRKSIARRAPARRRISRHSHIMSTVAALDDVFSKDLAKDMWQRLQLLSLSGFSSWYQRSQHFWPAPPDDIEKLEICMERLWRKLEMLWSSATEFSRARKQCQGRYFSRRNRSLQKSLKSVLEFKLSTHYLGPEGELVSALHEAQEFLSSSEVQSLGFHFWRSCHKAQLKFQMLSFYEDLLESDFEHVKEQQQQLLSIEDGLDEDQKQMEVEQQKVDRYMDRLERFIREVTIRLQTFVVLLLLFCKFSGISDNDQPMCITMPWNIRPALIVLWGVCWMFYNPEGHVDPTDTQDARLDGNRDLSMIDWPQWINDDLLPFSNLGPSPYNQDLVAQQPMLPAPTEASTPFSMPGFFQDQVLDAASLKQGLYSESPGRRAALDQKNAFKSLDLTSNFKALPKFPTISDDQPELSNGQLAGLYPELVSSSPQVTNKPNNLAEQLI